MAYVEFQQPPKGKKHSGRSREPLEQQVEEARYSDSSVRPRPKSKESLGLTFPLPSLSRSPSPPPPHSVTFKFKEMLETERPALAAMFPMTRLPGITEYIIISDSESEPEEEEEQVKREIIQPGRNKKQIRSKESESTNAPPASNVGMNADNLPENTGKDLENDELFKIDRTFKEKLSHLTKDFGSLLAQPKSNFREFLRRREGYEPPDKNPNPRRVCHTSDDDEEQLILDKNYRSPSYS